MNFLTPADRYRRGCSVHDQGSAKYSSQYFLPAEGSLWVVVMRELQHEPIIGGPFLFLAADPMAPSNGLSRMHLTLRQKRISSAGECHHQGVVKHQSRIVTPGGKGQEMKTYQPKFQTSLAVCHDNHGGENILTVSPSTLDATGAISACNIAQQALENRGHAQSGGERFQPIRDPETIDDHEGTRFLRGGKPNRRKFKWQGDHPIVSRAKAPLRRMCWPRRGMARYRCDKYGANVVGKE
ncbi:hypothetical protein JAAARDRAFT_682871 [Jaapia argillacea MUCL 33604]|uniref:Uncharacterized protein n=1 Tax=Jaapia argillacea MUCL 33604 TaxID=933084 RepID=A0A067QAH4_9AGAM|nr:hypothetical protein JAAARDRAFT_682871 [Jaapia argillacea MUCL 33604]